MMMIIHCTERLCTLHKRTAARLIPAILVYTGFLLHPARLRRPELISPASIDLIGVAALSLPERCQQDQ